MNGAMKWMPVLALLLAGVAQAATLKSMDDAELGEVNGREGIIVGLEIYYNAQKSANAALDGSGLGGTAGDLDGLCNDANNLCRTAWQLAGREARNLDNSKIPGGSGTFAAKGEWLVFKDSYLALKMPNLYLNGGFLKNALSAANVGGVAGTGYETFFDASRFFNGATCLLSDGAGGVNCTIANIKEAPALVMGHAPSSGASYNSATGASSGYTSISLGMKIGRLGVEYDNASGCTYQGGAGCGYKLDAMGSYIGLAIRDNLSPLAGIAVGGKMYLFGF